MVRVRRPRSSTSPSAFITRRAIAQSHTRRSAVTRGIGPKPSMSHWSAASSIRGRRDSTASDTTSSAPAIGRDSGNVPPRARSQSNTSASKRRWATDRVSDGAFGWLEVVEDAGHGGAGLGISEPTDHAAPSGGREHDSAAVERERGVAACEFVVGERCPAACHRREVLDLDGGGGVEQHRLVLGVQVVASVCDRSEHLDVGHGHVAGVERLGGLRMAAPRSVRSSPVGRRHLARGRSWKRSTTPGRGRRRTRRRPRRSRRSGGGSRRRGALGRCGPRRDARGAHHRTRWSDPRAASSSTSNTRSTLRNPNPNCKTQFGELALDFQSDSAAISRSSSASTRSTASSNESASIRPLNSA